MNDVRQRVDLFHGTADTIVDPTMARRVDQLLPDSHLHLVADAGHFVVLTHWDDPMTYLVDRARETTPARRGAQARRSGLCDTDQGAFGAVRGPIGVRLVWPPRHQAHPDQASGNT